MDGRRETRNDAKKGTMRALHQSRATLFRTNHARTAPSLAQLCSEPCSHCAGIEQHCSVSRPRSCIVRIQTSLLQVLLARKYHSFKVYIRAQRSGETSHRRPTKRREATTGDRHRPKGTMLALHQSRATLFREPCAHCTSLAQHCSIASFASCWRANCFSSAGFSIVSVHHLPAYGQWHSRSFFELDAVRRGTKILVITTPGLQEHRAFWTHTMLSGHDLVTLR